MSGSGKRVHEEFGNLSSNVAASVRQLEELTGVSAAVEQRPQIATEYSAMEEGLPEFRPPKLPRFDYARAGDDWLVDRHKSSAMEDPSLEVSLGLESKGDLREMRDPRDQGEMNLDMVRGYRDGICDNGRGDTLDDKPEREARIDGKEASGDLRGESKDPKGEKDHRSGRKPGLWKTEVKDYNWSMRVGRKKSVEEDGEFREPEEAVGENKIDWKREEKERERKKKDEKVRDREEKQREREEKQAGWRGNLQVHINTNDKKEGDRDEREAGRGRWDMEMEKKEKGREADRDKYPRRDRPEQDDTEILKGDREDLEGGKRPASEGGIPMENSSELERKLSRELESWKPSESLDRDRKNRFDRRPREQEKDTEEASPEEGIGEREKETFVNYGFQQRRRMLRPRGHSQAASREGRSRFRSKEMDGIQGNSETSAILYRPGEYMPELTKLWKDYEATLTVKNGENSNSNSGPVMEIRIPADLVTTSNHQVRGSQLWGTDIYTDDSDLVAVLMHTGYYRPTPSPPPPSILELRATIRVLSPQDSYTSTLRNNVRSRAWGAASGCSYSVERCRILKVGGGSIELEPCLARISAVAPTLAPVATERTMTTRAASSSAYRQQRFVQEVTIQYNLCNEPWMKYSMSIVADRGLKKSQYTSARLKMGEVLYVETHRNRYELSYDGDRVTCNGGFGATTATSVPPQVSGATEKARDKENEKTNTYVNHAHNGEKNLGRATHNNDKSQLQAQNGDAFDRYKWARCRQPLPLKVMLAKGVPLLSEFIEVLEDGLAWEEIQWSQAGVWVRGKDYPLARAQFLSPNLEDLDD